VGEIEGGLLKGFNAFVRQKPSGVVGRKIPDGNVYCLLL